MVTLHEVITFLVSMQISISSLQTHNVNRCGRSRHLARKDRKSGSAGMPRPISYAVFCLKKKTMLRCRTPGHCPNDHAPPNTHVLNRITSNADDDRYRVTVLDAN